VIHRDIEPANIMFDDQGKSFVVDLGSRNCLTDDRLTESGGAVGTPICRQQWRSEKLTPAADQYALAVTIYHLMTGRLPFEATTPYGMLHKHLNETPTAPQTYREDVSDALARVMDRALEKRPEDRYETVTAYANAFAGAVLEQAGSQTGFFTKPILKMKTPVTLAGSGINILISPDSPFATQMSRRSRVKAALFWVLSMVIVVAATAIILNVLTGNGNESSNAVSATGTRQALETEIAFAQRAISETLTALAASADMTATQLNQTIAPFARRSEFMQKQPLNRQTTH
jgi:serine/threonine protein kinase